MNRLLKAASAAAVANCAVIGAANPAITAPTNFSLFAESPDSYSHINVTFVDNSVVTLNGSPISGGDLLFPAAGDQGLAHRVNFSGDVAKSVKLRSIGEAVLETEGGAPSTVPEPATWAMMIAGFGLAGTVIRRRRYILRPLEKNRRPA